MSTALNYTPAYIGLLLAEILAITCNSFLDIRYGGFGFEVIVWSIAFAYSLYVGWRQHGVNHPSGQKIMRRFLGLGILLTFTVFLPIWNMPRAVVYILAALLVAYNCITTTRRQLHFGLMMSLVMVIFAATHYRADWSMLFYLLPYVAAVVFTLVAEQINRKVDDVRLQSANKQVWGAQGTAIAVATFAILFLGFLLYVLTPQITWGTFYSKWGSPSAMGFEHQGAEIEKGNQAGNSGSPSPQGGATGNQNSGNAGNWPSPTEMRRVANRPGMPQWQHDAIMKLADGSEALTKALKPFKDFIHSFKLNLKQWLQQHKKQLINLLMLLAFIAIIYAWWRLMREAKLGIWCMSRIDYVWLGVLRKHQPGKSGMMQMYAATQRLLSLYDMAREPSNNTQEYLLLCSTMRKDLRAELIEMTRLYEDARYGRVQDDTFNIARMHQLYCTLYQHIEV